MSGLPDTALTRRACRPRDPTGSAEVSPTTACVKTAWCVCAVYGDQGQVATSTVRAREPVLARQSLATRPAARPGFMSPRKARPAAGSRRQAASCLQAAGCRTGRPASRRPGPLGVTGARQATYEVVARLVARLGTLRELVVRPLRASQAIIAVALINASAYGNRTVLGNASRVSRRVAPCPGSP